jgi:hypothetical protein
MNKSHIIQRNRATAQSTPNAENWGVEMQKSPPLADLYTIAGHEAAHAVMRYLLGLPCTRLTADENGGFCYGTGKPIEFKQDILVTLAGMAWEAGCFFELINLRSSRFGDLDYARAQLESKFWHRIRRGRGGKVVIRRVDTCVKHLLREAIAILYPFDDEIDQLGMDLADCGDMSARRVAAYMRHAIKPRVRGVLEQLDESGVRRPEVRVARSIYAAFLAFHGQKQAIVTRPRSRRKPGATLQLP